MNQIPRISFSAAFVLAVMGSTPATLAGTAYQKALAAVAVARATLDIADERPVLPDVQRANPASKMLDVKTPSRGESKAVADGDQHRTSESSVSDNSQNLKSSGTVRRSRLELAGTVPISDVLPAQLVIGGWEQGCPNCVRLERDIRSVLAPYHWTIGDQATDQIRFIPVPMTETVPRIGLYQNGVQIKHWTGYQDPGMLSRQLRAAWDSAPHPFDRSMAIGVGGKIHAKARVRSVLDWWRQHIGEGHAATFRWDRTGAGSFALLAKGDWSAEALFGPSGRIELAAPEAVGLPVVSAGFAYRLMGPDVSLDFDPITIASLASKLGPSDSHQVAGVPVECVDPVTAWTVFAVLREVWQLLHPTCDLQMGGTISATAKLNDGNLVIEFQKCPSIRLVALFTFHLQVKRVEINETSVRVIFAGSRLIKERSFSVDE